LAALEDADDVFMDAPLRNSTFLDLTEMARTPSPRVIELTDTSSDDDDSDVVMEGTHTDNPEPNGNMRPTDFVFNSNIPIHPRRTIQPWAGSLRPQDWIPSREELHAEQVAFDRSLPAEMLQAGYPLYVSRFTLVFHPTTIFFQGNLGFRYGIDAPLSVGPLPGVGVR
jgi:hypothetical protein